jgi:hypothetical protein
MADNDDIESFWEGLRPPPRSPDERAKQAIETGLNRAREERRSRPNVINPTTYEVEEAQGQAILMNRLGERAQRRLARDVEEVRNPFTEVDVSNQLSSVGRAIQQEREVDALLERVEYDTAALEVPEDRTLAEIHTRFREAIVRRANQVIEERLIRVEPLTGEVLPDNPETQPSLTETHLATLTRTLQALGFPAIVELNRDRRTLYLTFSPPINTDIHLARTISIER